MRNASDSERRENVSARLAKTERSSSFSGRFLFYWNCLGLEQKFCSYKQLVTSRLFLEHEIGSDVI